MRESQLSASELRYIRFYRSMPMPIKRAMRWLSKNENTSVAYGLLMHAIFD